MSASKGSSRRARISPRSSPPRERRGFNSTQTEYLIFYDGTAGGACGIGSYRPDERLAADNLANRGGGFGIVYSGCWFNETPMHESAHMMGAVQYGAPNSTGTGGHCVDEVDVLCYAPDGGDLNQSGTITTCPGAPRFDCGFDDYFDSAPEPGEYLDTHWNLGSPLNRFLGLRRRRYDPGDSAATAATPRSAGAARPAASGRRRRMAPLPAAGAAQSEAATGADLRRPERRPGLFVRSARRPTRRRCSSAARR